MNTRRRLLTVGLLLPVAPAIVRADSLMRLRSPQQVISLVRVIIGPTVTITFPAQDARFIGMQPPGDWAIEQFYFMGKQ